MESRTTGQSYRVSPAWDGNLGAERSYSYSYTASDGSLSAMSAPGGGFAYVYDGLKRLSSRNLSVGNSAFLTREYGYLAGAGTNGTATPVSGLSNKKADGSTLSSYGYAYDAGGNILSISGSDSATYTYDAQGQLLTETRGNTTVSYSYDTFGNLRTVSDGTNTHTYTYGDANWKDLLTAYDGHSISYDAIGNPTTWYDGAAMTWTNGRRLATISATNDHAALSFTYDSDGLRLTKTVGSEVHKYTWQGGKLIAEQYGNTTLEFFYDESGAPYALLVRDTASVTPTEAWYYYVTDLQGDVMQILDASGNTVASYTYNAWGKILNLNNSTNANIGDLNPIRYRGYYYDTETGLYYVSSRYYDPEICRFISADDASYLGANGDFISYNLFAYCLNNPVNRTDATGTVSWAGVGAGLLLISAAVFTIATFGTGAPLAVAAAGIAFSTGVVTTAAAATETPMVIDLSISKQTPIHGTYGKYGTSVIIDFSKNEAYKYDHIGGGIGTCNGITYSVGFVNNYSKPEDYSRFFYDINVGNTVGGDLCFTPQDSLKKLKNTTNAECVTFSFPYGPSAGAGVDYYSQPVKLFAW